MNFQKWKFTVAHVSILLLFFSLSPSLSLARLLPQNKIKPSARQHQPKWRWRRRRFCGFETEGEDEDVEDEDKGYRFSGFETEDEDGDADMFETEDDEGYGFLLNPDGDTDRVRFETDRPIWNPDGLLILPIHLLLKLGGGRENEKRELRDMSLGLGVGQEERMTDFLVCLGVGRIDWLVLWGMCLSWWFWWNEFLVLHLVCLGCVTKKRESYERK